MLTLTHATERDVDLLIVEELYCNKEFIKWVVAQASSLNLDRSKIQSSEVVHSKRRLKNRREIDIQLNLLSKSSQKFTCLIENKLDADEQPEQGESYQAECRDIERAELAEKAIAILVAPEHYLQSNNTFKNKFDHTISYEQIIDFFASLAKDATKELGIRYRYRASLLDQAITKSRRGYEAVPVAEVDDFNRFYVSELRKHFPDLTPGPSMIKQGRPGESVTMIFHRNNLPDADFLPKNVRTVHQLREANVNINLGTWGNNYERIKEKITTDLIGSPIKLAATVNPRKGGNSGLMLFMSSPLIDNKKSAIGQLDQILEGIRLANELKHWFWTNLDLVKSWSKMIAELNEEA